MKIHVLYSPTSHSIELNYDSDMRAVFHAIYQVCKAFCRSRLARNVSRQNDPLLLEKWRKSLIVLGRLKRGHTRQTCLSADDALGAFHLVCVSVGNSKLARAQALETIFLFGAFAPCLVMTPPLPPLPEILNPAGLSESTIRIYRALAQGEATVPIPVLHASTMWTELSSHAEAHPTLDELLETLEGCTRPLRITLDWINGRL